jgi:hypothetical protein
MHKRGVIWEAVGVHKRDGSSRCKIFGLSYSAKESIMYVTMLDHKQSLQNFASTMLSLTYSVTCLVTRAQLASRTKACTKQLLKVDWLRTHIINSLEHSKC